jgi:hypothetical protein
MAKDHVYEEFTAFTSTPKINEIKKQTCSDKIQIRKYRTRVNNVTKISENSTADF